MQQNKYKNYKILVAIIILLMIAAWFQDESFL
jgi:hypothetical protein